jgi:rare lipoprotein A (peptidoglycan hydrolase)
LKIRAQEGALREVGCTPLLLGCRVLLKLMLFKTLSIFAIASVGLAPIQAKAASGCSLASHYGIGDGYHGQITANGERYNAYGNSTAHRYLPFGTRLRVTNQSNGKSVIVRVNDRGPFVGGRSLDLSYGAFNKIASSGQGVARVCYTLV